MKIDCKGGLWSILIVTCSRVIVTLSMASWIGFRVMADLFEGSYSHQQDFRCRRGKLLILPTFSPKWRCFLSVCLIHCGSYFMSIFEIVLVVVMSNHFIICGVRNFLNLEKGGVGWLDHVSLFLIFFTFFPYNKNTHQLHSETIRCLHIMKQEFQRRLEQPSPPHPSLDYALLHLWTSSSSGVCELGVKISLFAYFGSMVLK